VQYNQNYSENFHINKVLYLNFSRMVVIGLGYKRNNS